MKISTANSTTQLRPPGWGVRIGSWLGVMVIILTGVLVSPSTINDLFNPEGPGVDQVPAALDSTRLVDFKPDSRPIAPMGRMGRTLQTFQSGTAEDSASQIAGRNRLESAVQRSAADSVPREPVAMRILRGVRSSLKMSLLRLRQVRTLVEGRPTDGDQRIPPSFIPSRS